jgi:hypothetical protein
MFAERHKGHYNPLADKSNPKFCLDTVFSGIHGRNKNPIKKHRRGFAAFFIL